MTIALPPSPLVAQRGATADAVLTEVGGRTIVAIDIDGRSAGGSGAVEAEVVHRGLDLATEIGCPVVVRIRSVAVAPGASGLAGLVAWGRVARCAVALSGLVPLIAVVAGPVHGGLALVLGLADHVVFTRDATAYVNGPGPVATTTGVRVAAAELGGAVVHAARSGLASFVADDDAEAADLVADLLAHLPDNATAEPPTAHGTDPVGRPTVRAAAAVPTTAHRPYDVRDVIDDVVDRGSLLEVHADLAPNLVCGFGRIGGRPVAIVANQPLVRAGTLDIAASCKGARHVQFADAFGLPIVTLVDTPGYEPGRDLEWRGIIRHGAKLVHAYAEATVPRVAVILRKAYGGAYIVMDSRTMGNDVAFAWPTAEIAVLGAPGAVAILHRGDLAAAADPEIVQRELEDRYQARYCSPAIAAERGYIDAVIDPEATRVHVAAALARLAPKRLPSFQRVHRNGPL